jgi:hypothetical protein
MIVFGAAEVATGFRHEFFGLATAHSAASTPLGVSIGLLYIIAGVLVHTMNRTAARLAVIALVLDVVGRIVMVFAGLYPLTTARQMLSILVGTAIAAGFAVYVSLASRSLPA